MDNARQIWYRWTIQMIYTNGQCNTDMTQAESSIGTKTDGQCKTDMLQMATNKTDTQDTHDNTIQT